jgi:hypothetical protein
VVNLREKSPEISMAKHNEWYDQKGEMVWMNILKKKTSNPKNKNKTKKERAKRNFSMSIHIEQKRETEERKKRVMEGGEKGKHWKDSQPTQQVATSRSGRCGEITTV